MAMWMIDGLSSEDPVVLGHSLPFRNAGASLNLGSSPEIAVVTIVKKMKRTESNVGLIASVTVRDFGCLC